MAEPPLTLGEIAASLAALGAQYFNQQHYSDAEKSLVQAIEVLERLHNRLHPCLIGPLASLGAALAMQGRHREAETVLLRGLIIVAKTHSKDEHRIILQNLVYVYHQQDRQEDAARMHASLLKLLGENTFVVNDRSWRPVE